MKAKIMGLLKDEEGQGMVEYGLIIGLISVIAILAVTGVGTKVLAYFTNAEASMP
ncbi:Flp family type IVb pilin [Desulfosporosinus sp.]|uniref:Flp family type IVb pilin n=1 Tax=Desulfosporosinus sp. TaxID=157907 RepID=UPI0025BF8D52|nr:Flp family type IVb pilin [Desulfosporosinus sp.]MBC2723291.1 Flp family type IVb pilin [Desulfosporosinus sp.]MBC2725776.1 Flp family type IVb pilin [Desulfosporosinus sp.]